MGGSKSYLIDMDGVLVSGRTLIGGADRVVEQLLSTKAVRLVVEGARFIAKNPDPAGPSEQGLVPACDALAAPTRRPGESSAHPLRRRRTYAGNAARTGAEARTGLRDIPPYDERGKSLGGRGMNWLRARGAARGDT
jgi:ribonucleotide monophosphatase NagD (HAD superfamily)